MNECDLVMKGGITSGIVYPRAIIGLSKAYRFRQVGGASVGAIAAVIAAAAEYNRTDGGFDRLKEVPRDLADGLEDLFQPYRSYKKYFNRALDYFETGKEPSPLYWLSNAWGIRKAIKRLSRTNYGVCPGTTTDKKKGDALVEWLNRRIEFIAGQMASVEGPLPAEPLTFGKLREKGITLRLVTTNLSQKRPESLPLGPGFYVNHDDLKWIMPANIADWIVAQSKKRSDGLVEVPHGDKMPVLLAARLSLSFPMLFTTIPLFTPDWSLARADRQTIEKPVLNRFSDGGLSSNLPIHYFDSALPERPTFGINLTEHHNLRHGPDDGAEGWNRIYMPAQAGGGLSYGVSDISGLPGFLMSLINSAKDWQDSMQMRMPGYRERIVHIALKKNEGGANVRMKEAVKDRLFQLGDLTSERILQGHKLDDEQPPFDLNMHRWRRVLATSAALEEAVTELTDAYQKNPPSGDVGLASIQEMLDHMITNFPSADEWDSLGYEPQRGAVELANLKTRLDALLMLKSNWDAAPRDPKWRVPNPAASVRIRSIEI